MANGDLQGQFETSQKRVAELNAELSAAKELQLKVAREEANAKYSEVCAANVALEEENRNLASQLSELKAQYNQLESHNDTANAINSFLNQQLTERIEGLKCSTSRTNSITAYSDSYSATSRWEDCFKIQVLQHKMLGRLTYKGYRATQMTALQSSRLMVASEPLSLTM